MRTNVLARTAAFAALLALGAGLAAPEAQAQRKFIAIGTAGPTGVYFVVGNAICRMVHKDTGEGREGRTHGIRCAAPSTGGSIYNINQIAAGELDFGVVQSDWQYHAYNGTGRFEGNKVEKLRALFSAHPEPFHIMAAKGSGIKSWADLEGKRVNIGNPGSGQRGTFEVLMDIHGIGRDWFAQTTELTSTEQSGALCDGNIDAYGYTVGVPNSGVAQAADGCGAYIVGVDTEPVKKLVADNPYYAFVTIPKGVYSTTEADVTTFGPMTTVVASADTPDDVVYEVVRAVFENLDEFKGLHPAFAFLEPERMLEDGISIPYHPGAEKYYKEKGWR